MYLWKFRPQSPWLDYIRRDLFTTGELKRLIEEDGLKGMTSNPAIFEKAIGSEHYKDSIAKLALEKKLNAVSIYEKNCHRRYSDGSGRSARRL